MIQSKPTLATVTIDKSTALNSKGNTIAFVLDSGKGQRAVSLSLFDASGMSFGDVILMNEMY